MNASTHSSHFFPLSLSVTENHIIDQSDQISCPNYVTLQPHADPQALWPQAGLGVSALMWSKGSCEESHLQPSQIQCHLHSLFHTICIMPRSRTTQYV